MSKTIQSMLVAATISAGSAQAEAPKAPEVMTTTSAQAADLCEGRLQRWSAKDGFIGCIGAMPVQAQVPEKKTETSSRKMLGSASSLGLGEHGNIGVLDSKKYGTGVHVQLQGGGDTLQLALGASLTPKQQQAILNAGIQITENGILSFGVASTREDAKTSLDLDYTPETNNLEANQGFIRVDFGGFGPLAKGALAYIAGKAKDATLRNITETSLEVRVLDLPALVETWNDYFAQTTTTTFHGHKWQTLLAEGTLHVGEKGALTLRLGASQVDTIDGKKNHAVAGVTYEHFMDDAKATFSFEQNGKLRTAGMGYETKLDQNWSMGGKVERVDGLIKDTRAMLYVRYAESAPVSPYTRPQAGTVRADSVVAKNTTDTLLSIQDVGSRGDIREHVGPKVKTGEKLIDQTPKIPLAVSNLRAMVQTDGSVIISFDDVGQIPGSKYLCSINGGSDLECDDGTRFAANMFRAGEQNTIEIYVVNNAVAGKPETSKKVGVGVMIYNDSPTNTLAPELISLTHETLSVRYRISDADTVTSKACQLVQGTSIVATATPNTAGICTFSVSPETSYEVRTTGYANILGPDGKMTTQYVETRITVTTLEVPNTPPTSVSLTGVQTLIAGSLSLGQVVGTLHCADAESGNNCTYSTTDSRFTITGNTLGLSATGASLAAGSYTVPVIARDPQSAAYNGSISVTISDAADTTPPSLTSSSNLGASNIGTTVSHTLTFDEAIGSVSIGTVPTGMTVTPSQIGNTVTLQISTDATFTAFGSVIIPVTVADGVPNSGTVNVMKTINYVMPSLPTLLPDVGPVADNGGITPLTFSISMPNALDSSGNQIAYTVTGLPSIDGAGTPVTWNISQTGPTINISGIYVEGPIAGHTTTITLSVTSPSANGSTSVNILILSI